VWFGETALLVFNIYQTILDAVGLLRFKRSL